MARWTVEFDGDAVLDFEDVKSRSDRKAVFNVIRKLKDLGPDLPPPHMKSLKGEPSLCELRPRRGACEVRPIYVRLGQKFLVLAIAAKKKDFEQATSEAVRRLSCHWEGNNISVIMRPMGKPSKSFEALLAEEQLADPSFKAEWQRLAPAREFAAVLLRYRAAHKLTQRDLARKLGVSQPRVFKLESGEHNPGVDTVINAVRRLGIEFALDVAPANREPTLVTARARKAGAIAHDEVSVLAASSV